MEIDHYLSTYDFSEKHELFVLVEPLKAYQASKHVNFNDSAIIRFLLRLRGIKTTEELQPQLFTELVDTPQEVVLGLIAKPWTYSGGKVNITRGEFRDFVTSGYAKMAWNFSFTPKEGGTIVATETRIYCTDQKSRAKFRVYWIFIRPFSGLMRRLMLRLIKKKSLSG